jgi:antitoxin (DNA-binding transcriptional repressor) of toxin-antitoxin stability system
MDARFHTHPLASHGSGSRFREWPLLMKSTNASSARKTFARLLESVIKDGQPVVIVRYREPIAAIVPISRLLPAERALLKSKSRQ